MKQKYQFVYYVKRQRYVIAFDKSLKLRMYIFMYICIYNNTQRLFLKYVFHVHAQGV